MIQGMCPVPTGKTVQQALSPYNWHWILSPYHRSGKNMDRPYVIDNGAFTAYNKGHDFDDDLFMRYLDKFGDGCDWVVIPDVVGNGPESLELATKYIPKLTGLNLMLCIQEGITPAHVKEFLPYLHGIFLGTLENRDSKMGFWGRFSKKHNLRYHIGRVNSQSRINLCINAGADSFDGSGVVRWPPHGEKLSLWMRNNLVRNQQMKLFTGI